MTNVGHNGGVHPKKTNDGELIFDFVFHSLFAMILTKYCLPHFL